MKPGSWPRFRAPGLRHVAARDRALAEDVTHDCYVRCSPRPAHYDLPRDGTKLLYKAITNACIDKNYRDRRMVSLEAEVARRDNGHTDSAPQPGGDPHELAARRELEEAVAIELAAVDRRPARRARVEKPGLLARGNRRGPGHEPEQCGGAGAPGSQDPRRPSREVPGGAAR